MTDPMSSSSGPSEALHPPRLPAAIRGVLRVASRRPLLIAGWLLVAALPIAYVASLAIAHSRDIVFWDEFDTALDLVLRIDAGAGRGELWQRFVAINNEHRMVTSRLMYAGIYWFTGTLNFHVVSAIGNLCLLGAGAVLVCGVSGWERRVRLAVVLAFALFQLEHFESFIWSGASIDHFQILLHAMLAVVLLTRGTPWTSVAAAGCGLLATFTLAHGNVVWPLGALMLAHQRRWRALAGWSVFGVLAVAAFLRGFEFNPGHRISEPGLANFLQLGRYWLTLLGAPLTLGQAAWAPVPGALLVAALAWLARRGMAARQPVAFFGALFALGAITLVTLGRAEFAGGAVNSRYLIHGALAWGLVVFLLLEVAVEARPAHPLRPLVFVLPALVAFSVAANRKFAPLVESFTAVRDRAATAFEQHGSDGRSITKFRLHPRDKHADVLLKMAEDRGVYRLPEFSPAATFAAPTPTTQLMHYVDEIFASDRAVTVGGWAMLPGVESRRGHTYVVLRSEKSLRYFRAVTLQRADLAAHYKEPKWQLSGFRAVIRRAKLPAESFAIGLLVTHGGKAEFVMTGSRLDLSGAEPRIVQAPYAP